MWESIRRRWESADISVLPRAVEAELEVFERRYHVRLPSAMRSFYGDVGGMASGAWDEELIRFWPLSDVGPVPELLSRCRGIPDYGGIEQSLPGAGSYFVFADYSIWLHVYAVWLSAELLGPSPVVWIAGGDTWEHLAVSFGEFLQRYAEDLRRVLFPGASLAEPDAPADRPHEDGASGPKLTPA